MTTTVRLTIVPGSRTGKSGKRYKFGTAEGTCDLCGTPFGVVSAFGPGELDPRPRVSFVHDADDPPPVHHLEMTGNSDAARALRSQPIASTTEVLTDGPVN